MCRIVANTENFTMKPNQLLMTSLILPIILFIHVKASRLPLAEDTTDLQQTVSVRVRVTNGKWCNTVYIMVMQQLQ